jgi:hypothetical protein
MLCILLVYQMYVEKRGWSGGLQTRQLFTLCVHTSLRDYKINSSLQYFVFSFKCLRKRGSGHHYNMWAHTHHYNALSNACEKEGVGTIIISEHTSIETN